MPNADNSTEDPWALTPAEYALVMTKNRGNRLGFALLLTFFRERGRFPREQAEVAPDGIAALNQQLDLSAPKYDEALLTGRTAERWRAEIRIRFGFREATIADAEMLTVWLRDDVAGEVGGVIEPLIERLEMRCHELAIEPPTPDRVERIVRTAIRAHEERFHRGTYERLSPGTRDRLDDLLRPEKADGDNALEDMGGMPAVLLKLRGSPGRPSLASMQEELAKLELIRQVALPASLFDDTSPRELEHCRWRVSVEAPHETPPASRRGTPDLAGRLRLSARPQPDRRPGGPADRDHPSNRCARRA